VVGAFRLPEKPLINRDSVKNHKGPFNKLGRAPGYSGQRLCTGPFPGRFSPLFWRGSDFQREGHACENAISPAIVFQKTWISQAGAAFLI